MAEEERTQEGPALLITALHVPYKSVGLTFYTMRLWAPFSHQSLFSKSAPLCSLSFWGSVSFLWNSRGSRGNSLLLWLLMLPLFISLSLATCGLAMPQHCGLPLTACPRACLRCSRRDRCQRCEQGFFLKNGLCVSSCIPGFTHANATCAGKCSSDGLACRPAISPHRGSVWRYSQLM